MILWVFIAVIVVAYFGVLRPVPGHPVALTVPMILFFSLIGIAGSYGVAWFGFASTPSQIRARVREFGRQALPNLRDST